MTGSVVMPLFLRSRAFGRLTLSCRQYVLARNRLLQVQAHVLKYDQVGHTTPSVGCCVITKPSSAYFSTTKKQCAKSGTSQGLLSKIKFDLGLISGLKFNKSVLKLSAFRMIICCTEMIDYKDFFKEFDMPDTFNSWFLITNLHIWLCMLRIGALGKDGRLLRNYLIKAFWEDVEARSKQLGSAATLSARQEGIKELVNVFHASLFSYDEGLLGNDKELAAALWRMLFEMKPDIEPSHLELMVQYVRKQVAHLDSQEESIVLGRGFVTFLPIKGDQVDEQMTRRQAVTVNRLRTGN